MDTANKTIEEFKDKDIDEIAIEGDVSKQDDQFNLVSKTIDKYGSVDFL